MTGPDAKDEQDRYRKSAHYRHHDTLSALGTCQQFRLVSALGNLIHRDWFRRYDLLPQSNFRTKILPSWDIAMMVGNQHDYSVCTTWMAQKNDYYLVDVIRRRVEYPDLRRLVIAKAGEHRATTVLIEEIGPGLQLLQDLRFETPNGMTRPIGWKPIGSKLERMATPSAKIEAGHVYLPKDAP
jgi:predicted phage terminase large subunit-like protein